MSMPPASHPPSAGILIENQFVRERNVLLSSADFGPLYVDYFLHLKAFGISVEPGNARLFQDFLAGFSLHAASHPRNEILAWTIHFQRPALNLFLAADTEFSTVTGRVFTEGLRQEDSNMFYQELVVRGKPLHRSIVPFQGTGARESIEFFYSQSEQRPGRFVHLGGDRYTLLTAHPDFDEHWFRQLDDEAVRHLHAHETLVPIEKRTFRWFCGCHYAKILEILGGPMEADPDALFGSDETITVNCPRCSARYRISREAMEAHVEERRRTAGPA